MNLSHRNFALPAGIAAAALFSVCGLAVGSAGPAAGQYEALKDIQGQYPGLNLVQEQGRMHIIAGMPMGGGATAQASSESWVVNHMAALGGGGSTFQEAWNATFQDGSKTVYCYQQYIGGIPVEYGIAKILVLNNGTNPVVYAAGTVAPAPAQGFAAMRVDGKTAVAIAQQLPGSKKLTRWSTPELVVFQGNGDWIEPVRTWKVTGESPNINDAARITYFVDAATGQLAGMRNEVVNDVIGTARGLGTPGLGPDTASNVPIIFNMPEILASNTGNSGAYSDRNGNFVAPGGGLFGTTTTTGVSALNGYGGRWVDVRPVGGSGITASQFIAVPPGPASLVLNPGPAQTTTAQVNAFLVTNAIHDYFRDRSGTFSMIDLRLPANTGVAGSCNAFFNGSSINFYNAGGGCVNTAYTTVIAHEYGHFIVSKLGNGAGLPQNAFGEGYGDTGAMLLYDTHILGQDFSGPGTTVRDPLAANKQYPCAGEIHDCGQVLGGVWWNIRTAFGAFYGSGPGLTSTRQLEVNWSLITTGGPDSSNSAGPGTLVEVLTADDNDGNLSNGTPNLSRICPSFGSHNIVGNVCSPGAPTNNYCADAAVITNGSTPFTTVGATTDGPAEANCALCCGDLQVNQDVWYTYTATCTGVVTVSLCDASYDSKVAIYDGAACPSVANTALACNDDFCGTFGLQSQVAFNSVIGQQYKIRIGGYQAATGTGNIVITVVPGNDSCANAFPAGIGSTPFSTEGATTDGPTEGNCSWADLQVNQDVWYTYTSPGTGTTTVSLCGSNYDSRIAVYNGAGCPSGPNTAIACDDDFCDLQSQTYFASVAGQQYKIRVGGYLTAFGSGGMTISFDPGNDLCANAIPISNGATPFTTVRASTDGPSEGNCSFFEDLQVNHDIWYRYTAGCTGIVTVGLCGSSFDTKVAVYSGTTCPSAPNTAIACNDDFCGFQSQTTFNGVAGQSYLIRVGGYSINDAGSGIINLSCAPAACYANCDGSTVPPILNVNDFTCFLNQYAAGDPTANCDGSTAPPVLNVNDFICFQNRYSQGCP